MGGWFPSENNATLSEDWIGWDFQIGRVWQKVQIKIIKGGLSLPWWVVQIPVSQCILPCSQNFGLLSFLFFLNKFRFLNYFESINLDLVNTTLIIC